MAGMPSVPPVTAVEAVGEVVAPDPVVRVQVALDIELRLEDPGCVASIPTPPGLKRPVEVEVTPVRALPIPVLEHVVPGKLGMAPEIGPGLTPGVTSSVAPRGTPKGTPMGTPMGMPGDPADAPGIIPSGDVGLIPSGEVVPIPGALICA
jgi:hypothetical protein